MRESETPHTQKVPRQKGKVIVHDILSWGCSKERGLQEALGGRARVQ